MPLGDKGVIGTVIDVLTDIERRGEQAVGSAANAFGEKLLGPTAESEHRKAEVIAPEAPSTEPTTVGRRSKGPDGQDPFHGSSTQSEDNLGVDTGESNE